MRLRQLVLRAYAERDHDGSWFAICLELNLYARADSFEEARAKLNQLIVGYLKEAVTKDAEYIDDLVPRPAPLTFWLKYGLVWCWLKMHQAANSHRKFKLPFPMAPAM